MTDVITRRDLLRRAAAGGAFLTVPGVLAACGGSSVESSSSGGRQDAREDVALLELDALHRQREGEQAPDARHVQEEDRHDRAVHRGHQRQRVVLRQDPGAALARSVDRPRHHRHDRQLAVSGAADQEGLGREARQERDPEHQEPRAGAAASELGHEPRLQPALAVRHDGHRVQRQADRSGPRRSTTCSRTRSSRERSRSSPRWATR